MKAPDRIFLSEDEFMALDVHDGLRRELFDGELIVSPSPMPHHQRVVFKLAQVLMNWADARGESWEVTGAPLDVWFGPLRILEPDLLVFEAPPDNVLPVRVLPALIVEVLSPSTAQYDRLAKRLAYAAAGVGEYWIVDPGGSVDRHVGADLRDRATFTDAMPAATLPGLVVDLAAIWPAPSR